MIHSLQLNNNSILDALALMPKLMALPSKIGHWGLGAKTESDWICTSDVAFGSAFWKSITSIFDSFQSQCLADDHAADFSAYLEKDDQAFPKVRFVCASGTHKTTT